MVTVCLDGSTFALNVVVVVAAAVDDEKMPPVRDSAH